MFTSANIKKLVTLFSLSFILLCLCSCKSKSPENAAINSLKASDGSTVLYEAVFNEDNKTDIPYGFIDLSNINEGYIAVKCDSDKKLKFQIKHLSHETYTYDVLSGNKINIYSLNFGDGSYTLKLMENIEDTSYTEVWSENIEVKLRNMFYPFVRPNQYCMFSADSNAVKLAEELVKDTPDALEAASIIYEYVVDNIEYDYEKAETVTSGYLPDPDSTLSEKKGICLDYASLAAAMLRSQDIPCQIITGYFTEDSIYHAWNRIFIEGEGWLTVEIKVSGDTWKRVDATMAAAGENTENLENGSLYTERSIY